MVSQQYNISTTHLLGNFPNLFSISLVDVYICNYFILVLNYEDKALTILFMVLVLKLYVLFSETREWSNFE